MCITFFYFLGFFQRKVTQTLASRAYKLTNRIPISKKVKFNTLTNGIKIFTLLLKKKHCDPNPNF